jgi:hypothetical protein
VGEVTTIECGIVTIQANWPEDVLNSDGTLRKLTPIKVLQLMFGGHLDTDTGKPDDISYTTLSQIN